MIREIITEPQSRYGRFFLSLEAPGDETPKKGNTKVVNVKPNNRKRLDFTSGAEDEAEDNDMTEETPDDNDYASDEGDTTDDNTDYSAGVDIDAEGNVVTPTDGGDTTQTDAPADGGGVDIDANGNVVTPTEDTAAPTETPTDGGGVDIDAEGNVVTSTDDAGAGEGEPEVQGEEPAEGGDNVEVDTGAEEDYTDGSEDTTTDDTTDTGTTDTNTDTDDKKGPGLEYDSTRKYILFENFISLNNAIENYISKLENIISDDFERNKIVKTSINKLREIQELCETYMTMKFEVSGYIQSLLFYQNLIVMIQLVFDSFNKASKINKNINK